MTRLQRTLCAAILALTSATCFAAVPAAASVVFQPHFETTHGDIHAGKAFVISTKACGAVVLSAYHLFGELGGLKVPIPVAELTPSIKSIVLNHIATGKSVFKIAGASVTPPGAAACCESDAPMTGVGDVFAYSTAKWSPIPRQSGHRFHGNLATDSTSIRPPIPRESGHRFHGKPATIFGPDGSDMN